VRWLAGESKARGAAVNSRADRRRHGASPFAPSRSNSNGTRSRPSILHQPHRRHRGVRSRMAAARHAQLQLRRQRPSVHLIMAVLWAVTRRCQQPHRCRCERDALCRSGSGHAAARDNAACCACARCRVAVRGALQPAMGRICLASSSCSGRLEWLRRWRWLA
jgi:hypothetical protein